MQVDFIDCVNDCALTLLIVIDCIDFSSLDIQYNIDSFISLRVLCFVTSYWKRHEEETFLTHGKSSYGKNTLS